MAEAYIELPNGQFERAQSVSLGGRTVLMETVVLSKSNGDLVDPASEATLKSIETFAGSISSTQTDGSQRTAIRVFGADITANNPFPTDGDSLYIKDINAANSDAGTFTGTITDLFDTSTPGYMVDNSSTNPKHFTVQLNRPISSDDIGIETTDGNFSNVKIELMDALGNVLFTLNDSANNTKYTAHCYDFIPVKFCRLKISFYTADAVKIKFLSIDKIIQAASRMQAIDEDTGLIGNVQMSGGDWNVLARLRNAIGNTKINPATSDKQTDGTQKSQMLGKTDDATFQVPRVDVVTHALKTIDYPHSEMHNGDHFYFIEPITLGSAAVQDYLITTPNTTRWGHFELEATSLFKITIGFYEATDKTGTTPQAVFNNNRNSATTATLTVHKGTSGGTTDGTNIYPCHSGSASAAGRSGNIRSGDGELLLKQNTKYILRITSGAANNDICVKIWWYEHTSRSV